MQHHVHPSRRPSKLQAMRGQHVYAVAWEAVGTRNIRVSLVNLSYARTIKGSDDMESIVRIIAIGHMPNGLSDQGRVLLHDIQVVG